MNAQVAVAILELALEKGVPAVISIMQSWNKEEITVEDIQDLREGMKPPGEF